MSEKLKSFFENKLNDKTKEKLTSLSELFKKIIDFLKEKKFNFEYIFAAFLAAFCLVNSYYIFKLKDFSFFDKDFLTRFSHTQFLLILIILFVVILALHFIPPVGKWVPRMLVISSLVYAVLLVNKKREDIYFNIGLALILCCVLYWVTKDNKLDFDKLKPSYSVTWIFAGVAFIVYVAFVGYWTIIHTANYTTSAFDTGIFAQTFEYMRTTGYPDNTIERNQFISHFAIHFSPFFYVLLPGYMIFPSVNYLIIMQAVGIGAGVFAVNGICKQLKYSPQTTMIFDLTYLFLPTLTGGAFFEWHENKFLSVFVLFTVYFILKKNTPITLLFMLLTLSIKEDAFIYVLAIGLWVIFCERKRILGVFMCVFSGIYFAVAMKVMSVLGDENFNYRFENFMLDHPDGEQAGFGDMIKICLFDFGYFVSQCFTQEKIYFLIWFFLPLLFLPILSKKRFDLLLLIPILPIHLMSSWVYQYDKDFQYTYGTIALALFATLLAVRHFPKDKQKFLALCTLFVSIICFWSNTAGKVEYNLTRYKEDKAVFSRVDFILEQIPSDASVVCTTYFAPHIAKRKILYLVDDSRNELTEKLKCDYMIVNPKENDYRTFAEIYTDEGYTSWLKGEEVEVFKKPTE